MKVLKPTFGVIGTNLFALLMLICSGCSPNRTVHSDNTNNASVSNNLRQIYWVLVRASGDAPNFPDSFSNLNASVNPNLFVCPQSGRQPGPMYEVENWTDYIYVGNQTDGALSEVAMVLSPPENHGGEKGYVLFVDGSISVLPSDQIRRLIKDPFCMATNGTPNNTPGNIENEKQRAGIRVPKRFSSYLAVP